MCRVADDAEMLFFSDSQVSFNLLEVSIRRKAGQRGFMRARPSPHQRVLCFHKCDVSCFLDQALAPDCDSPAVVIQQAHCLRG